MNNGFIPGEPGVSVYTEERCHITELMNHAQCPDVSVAECRVASGVTTQLHQLPVTERYVVTAGYGRMDLDGDSFDVSPGDCVVIAPNQAQRITNTGSEDLTFLCVCTPRFLPEHYLNLET